MQRLRNDTFVEQANVALFGLLATIDNRWPSDGLCRYYTQHQQPVINYMREHEGFMAVIRHIFENYGSSLAQTDVLQDPTTLNDLAAFAAFLADHYPASLASPDRQEVEKIISELQPRISLELIHSLLPQVLKLAEVIWRIEEFVHKELPPDGRVFILEFPVGNSIPSKLLDNILRHERRESRLVRISLSRNDAKKRGMTRKQLLEKKLAELNSKSEDIVVLIDEWLTGSNFRTLTDLLERNPYIRKSRFLPVALLTAQSNRDNRYESHVAEHNRLLRKLNEQGDDWRIIFPRINTRIERDGYFFWSEYDRLSGYRKVQILGSYVSSIDAVLKKLSEDREALRGARVRFLSLVAEMRARGVVGPEITPSVLADQGTLDQLFIESYEDYSCCHEQLCAIEHATNLGTVSDIEEDIRQVVEKIHDIIDGRSAKLCVLLALLYIEDERMIDPEDQYLLQSLAPVVVELSGGFRRLHESVMLDLMGITLGQNPKSKNSNS